MGNEMDVRNRESFLLITDDADGEIMNDLLRLDQAGLSTEVQLLNYYKEIPLISSAKNLKFSGNRLLCNVNEAQARAIEFSRDTVLKSRNLVNSIYASAYHDAKTGELVLSGFSYVQTLAGRRASIRIPMSMNVSIESGAHKLKGQVLDISLGGCAINIAGDPSGHAGQKFLHLNSPAGLNQEIIVPIELIRTQPCEQGALHRCTFLFNHEKDTESRIEELIILRQTEILNELQHGCDC